MIKPMNFGGVHIKYIAAPNLQVPPSIQIEVTAKEGTLKSLGVKNPLKDNEFRLSYQQDFHDLEAEDSISVFLENPAVKNLTEYADFLQKQFDSEHKFSAENEKILLSSLKHDPGIVDPEEHAWELAGDEEVYAQQSALQKKFGSIHTNLMEVLNTLVPENLETKNRIIQDNWDLFKESIGQIQFKNIQAELHNPEKRPLVKALALLTESSPAQWTPDTFRPLEDLDVEKTEWPIIGFAIISERFHPPRI